MSVLLNYTYLITFNTEDWEDWLSTSLTKDLYPHPVQSPWFDWTSDFAEFVEYSHDLYPYSLDWIQPWWHPVSFLVSLSSYITGLFVSCLPLSKMIDTARSLKSLWLIFFCYIIYFPTTFPPHTQAGWMVCVSCYILHANKRKYSDLCSLCMQISENQIMVEGPHNLPTVRLYTCINQYIIMTI